MIYGEKFIMHHPLVVEEKRINLPEEKPACQEGEET